MSEDLDREMWMPHDKHILMKAMVGRIRPDSDNVYPMDVMFPQEINGLGDGCAIDEGSADLIYGMVRGLRPKIVLETGTHKGRSTRAICEALLKNGQGHLWTVDMQDHGLLTSGAIRENEKPFVTQIIGHMPEAYDGEPLLSLQGIDFAFIDGDHSLEGVKSDMEYVRAHMADRCHVMVENADDLDWPDVKEYFSQYTDFPTVCVTTVTGMQIIHMRRQ